MAELGTDPGEPQVVEIHNIIWGHGPLMPAAASVDRKPSWLGPLGLEACTAPQ
jgi:hypothetical protein